jgi:hypothetical protein
MHESPESFVEAEAAGHTWVRRVPRPADDRVLGHTLNWLNALPLGVRPVHLQADFPRIANDLCLRWFETLELDSYFAALEFSPREDRKGFTPLIKEELLAMHVYSLRNRQAPYEQRVPHQLSLLG